MGSARLPIIVNLWAGPGAGKSVQASGVFHMLKVAGIRCELVTEFAKELTYLGRTDERDHAMWVTACQEHRHYILRDKVDVIVTDSPTGLGAAYTKAWRDGDLIKSYAKNVARPRYTNLDFFLIRRMDRLYEAYGRRERSIGEALEKDEKVQGILEFLAPQAHHVRIGDSTCTVIVGAIRAALAAAAGDPKA